MEEDPIDAGVLRDLLETLGGDAAVLDELVDAFLVDAADLVDQAFAGVAENDTDRFRRAVHSLKTTSSTFGAMELSSICERFEHAARQEGVIAVDELDELDQACRRATDALRTRLRSG